MTGCTLAITAALVLSAHNFAPSLAELEQSALAYRRAITRGHVVVKSTSLKKSDNPAANERTTNVWFDGRRLRNDLFIHYAEAAPVHRELYCRAGSGPDSALDYAIYYSEQKQPEGTTLAIHMDELNERWNIPMLHPNMIGMAVDDTPNLAQHNSDALVGRTDRTDLHLVRDGEISGNIWQITYLGSGREQVSLWLDADKGPSVIRARLEWPPDKARVVDSIEITLQPCGAARLWYPVRAVYKRHIDDDLYDGEEAEIEVLSLNEDLPDDAFALAGMGLPARTPLGPLKEKGTGRLLEWDGKNIVPRPYGPNAPSLPPETAPAKRGGWRLVLFVNAIILAVLAAGLIGRLLFAKRRNV